MSVTTTESLESSSFINAFTGALASMSGHNEELTQLDSLISDADNRSSFNEKSLDQLFEVASGTHRVFDLFTSRSMVRPLEKLLVRAPTFIIQSEDDGDFFV